MILMVIFGWMIVHQLLMLSMSIDIYQTLFTIYELDISPFFCASLFKPLIEHAIHNVHLNEHLETYAATLTELYKYTLSKDFLAAINLFNNHVSLIQGNANARSIKP